jgi:DNA-binding NtrC family response regulator
VVSDSAGPPVRPLAGKQVLIVEDETLIAMLLEDMIRDLGGIIAATASRVDRARQIIEDSSVRLDLAVLDVNIAGEPVFPLASLLSERGVPFAFSTGYGSATLPEPWRGRPTLHKPFTLEQVGSVLAKALAASKP